MEKAKSILYKENSDKKEVGDKEKTWKLKFINGFYLKS